MVMCRLGVTQKTIKEFHGSLGSGGDVALSLCNSLSLLSCLKILPLFVDTFDPGLDTLLSQSIPGDSGCEFLLRLLSNSLIARRTVTFLPADLWVPLSPPAPVFVVPGEAAIPLAPRHLTIGRIDAAIHEHGVGLSESSKRSCSVLGEFDLPLRQVAHLLFHL